jgi:hypothetical protein
MSSIKSHSSTGCSAIRISLPECQMTGCLPFASLDPRSLKRFFCNIPGKIAVECKPSHSVIGLKGKFREAESLPLALRISVIRYGDCGIATQSVKVSNKHRSGDRISIGSSCHVPLIGKIIIEFMVCGWGCCISVSTCSIDIPARWWNFNWNRVWSWLLQSHEQRREIIGNGILLWI